MSSKPLSAEEVIELLQLSPLEGEGGFYRRIWTSPHSASPPSGGKAASYRAGSAIYYLITESSFSSLHYLKSDELWHFYLGDAVDLFLFPQHKDEAPQKIQLGRDLAAGERPFSPVPAGTLMGARLREGEWALLGNTLTPSFEAEDYSLVTTEEALKKWPDYATWIHSLEADPS